MENPLSRFAELKGPRVERTRRNLLQANVLIAIAAILSGTGRWDEIERNGRHEGAPKGHNHRFISPAMTISFL